MTVAQAAERAAVCKNMIYGWCADGALPHSRLGKKGCRGVIRIAEADLDAFLAGAKVHPVAPPAPMKPRAVKLKHLVVD